MGVTIRRAHPGDARRIAEVHVGSWRAAYSNILSSEIMSQLSVDERQDMWTRVLNLPTDDPTRVFVLETGEGIVGFSLSLAGRDEDLDPTSTAELAGLYFLAQSWRRGLGTKLQRQALDELESQGFQDAVLWVLEQNHAARSFYEATGWKFDKRDPSYRDFDTPSLRYHRHL